MPTINLDDHDDQEVDAQHDNDEFDNLIDEHIEHFNDLDSLYDIIEWARVLLDVVDSRATYVGAAELDAPDRWPDDDIAGAIHLAHLDSRAAYDEATIAAKRWAATHPLGGT